MSQSPSQSAAEMLDQSPLPLYYQVANLVRNEILSGAWSPGSKLPTEKDLAGKYGVSRPTIRNAKALLAREGFIRSVKGSGCYLNGQETWRSVPPTVNNLNDIFHIGSKMSFRVHEFGMVSNNKEVKERLKNPEDRFVFHIRGTRWFQGQPISFVTYYIPFRFGSRIPLESLDGNPFIPQLEKMAGIQVLEGVQNISLGRAGAMAAEYLGLRKGEPVLMVRTVYVDEDHRPIEYVVTQYRQELPYAIRVKRN